jgi:hypothetical protein
MIEVKRLSGALNTDDKVQDVIANQHIDANNIRFTGGANGLTAENIRGNYIIDNNDLPAGTNNCIGAFFDQLNQKIIWFNYNSNGDNGIYELDISTEVVSPIFICGIDSATDILNFSLDYPVHSVNIIYRDAGNLLYWTDGYNRPRYLNIDSTSITALSPFTEEMINAAKQPPLVPPTSVRYGTDLTTPYNNVYNRYFRFAYRWVYVNGEKSTFSPTSECPIPSTTNPQDPIPPTTNNYIIVDGLYSAFTEDFSAIELYGQQFNGAVFEDFFLIARLDRTAPLPYVQTFNFYNDSAYVPILPEESDLRYDRLPDLANTLELLNGNVLIYGGITEGYDFIKRGDVDVQITSTLSTAASTYPGISPVWKWGQNERFGLIYFDQYGKTNGVVSYLDNATDTTNFDVTTPEYVGEALGLGIATPRISASINHLPPNWAVSYQWVRQDIAPIFFLQYVTSDYQTDIDFDYLCIEGLNYNNTQGFVPAYDFAKGDRVKILGTFISTSIVNTFGIIYDFEILEVVTRPMNPPPNSQPRNGSFLKLKKLGGAPPYVAKMFIEIYTPNVISRSDVVFYEWGQRYGIYEIAGIKYHEGDTQNQTALLPATFVWDNGPFYVKSRRFPLYQNYSLGNCGVIDRNFNDFTPSKANNNSRQWIIEEDSKREYLSVSVRWGGSYLQDSNVNELNRFYPSSIDTIDRSRGDIRRFKSRDRILRVFQDRGVGQYGVFTRYIQNNSGSNELVTTNEIITANNIQYYAGVYGLCGYPTNLVSSQKADYFTDVVTGRSVRLAQDGLTDLGLLYKGQYYLSSLVTPYNSVITKTNGSKSKVMGFYDFFDDQYNIVLEGQGDTCESYTVTKVASSILPTVVYYTDCNGVPQNHTVLLEGDVFNFCAIQGSVDITTEGGGALELVDNGIGGCGNAGPLPYNWSFNERRNAFCSFYDFHPEWAVGANDMIYTWVNGGLWKHNNTNEYCNFYTNPANASVTVVMNNNLLTKKSWNSLNEIATDVWEVPEMYTNSYSYGTPGFGPPAPQVQESNLVAEEFTFLEGNPSTAIKRDINSPGGKINGNFMKGNYLVLKLQKTSAQSLVTLSEISVRFTESPLTAK